MNDTVKMFLNEDGNGRVTIDFVLYTDYLLNSQILDVLEFFFDIDYLGARRITTEDKTTIVIETDKGKALTYLQLIKKNWINS